MLEPERERGKDSRPLKRMDIFIFYYIFPSLSLSFALFTSFFPSSDLAQIAPASQTWEQIIDNGEIHCGPLAVFKVSFQSDTTRLQLEGYGKFLKSSVNSHQNISSAGTLKRLKLLHSDKASLVLQL